MSQSETCACDAGSGTRCRSWRPTSSSGAARRRTPCPPGPQDPVDTVTEKADPSVWYQLYLKEREHLAKVCALALRAGIEERKVKLAESQGLLVADAIRRILGALGLTGAAAARTRNRPSGATLTPSTSPGPPRRSGQVGLIPA